MSEEQTVTYELEGEIALVGLNRPDKRNCFNPLVMKQMAEHVHDAASYAPVTILIDERPDGVHLSYDRMASYLASYGNLAALEVARTLDARIEALLTAAAN